jgi:hypothetical protein
LLGEKALINPTSTNPKMAKIVLSIVILAVILVIISGYASRNFLPSSLTRLQSTAGNEQVYQLFVGNLPFNVDDKQLNELVSQRIGSTYKSLRIAQDKKTGKSRGNLLKTLAYCSSKLIY